MLVDVVVVVAVSVSLVMRASFGQMRVTTVSKRNIVRRAMAIDELKPNIGLSLIVIAELRPTDSFLLI